MEMKICPKCFSEHTKSGKFCSRSCANSRKHTEETKRKQSIANSGKKYPNRPKKIVGEKINKCEACSKEFLVNIKSTKKTCSEICRRSLAGGYREGSGRSKSGYYKGIYSGSTFELAWIIYNIDNNIKFIRFPNMLYSKKLDKKYFPDFLIDNKIIEIKGFENKQDVDLKCLVAKEHGYDIEVLYEKDLKICFEWCKNNYSYKNLFELYDNHKPKYLYFCSNCGVEFQTDLKRVREKKYCCRECSAIGNRNNHTEKTSIVNK